MAHFQRHHYFFQRGVARALAQAIDRTFDLARATGDSGQSVGGRHAQIVMAMGGEDHILGPRHLGDQAADQIGAFHRRGIAHRVGDVDGAGARLDRDFHHTGQVIPLGPRRIHRRPLDIVAQVARMANGVVDALGHLIHRQIGNGPVHGRGADEGMDARGFRVAHRLPAAVDILEARARQPTDRGIARLLGDLGDSGKIPFRGDGKARFDDIDAHLVEQPRDLQLFIMAHRGTRRLLAVAQRGVENQDAVFVGGHNI